MSALAEALGTAQAKALAALEKAYVRGVIDAGTPLDDDYPESDDE